MKTTTYQNDPKFKRDFVKMTVLHRKQDRYLKGTYQQGSGESFKGCSLGCSIRSLKLLGRNGMGFGDHAGFAAVIHWPEWLCRLQDTIFEGLPDGESEMWTERLAKAVPVGAKNLDPVKWRFCSFILKENIERVLALTLEESLKEKVVSSIRGVLAVHESALISGWDQAAACSAARSAAYSADSADSACSAACSAARSAAYSADSAAYSAAYSADSARSAAYSADSACSACSAARSAAYSRYAKELLRLLKKAK